MASYVVPQVEIHQLFSEIPVSLTQNQVPFIFGPNYLLHRYEDKKDTLAGEYIVEENSTGVDLEFPNYLDFDKVDRSYDSIKVFADNAFVRLGRIIVDGDVFKASFDDSTGDTALDRIVIEAPAGRLSDILPELTVGRVIRINDTYDVKLLNVKEKSDTTTVITIDEELPSDTGFESFILCEVRDGVEIPRKDLSDTTKSHVQWNVVEDTDDTGAPVLKLSLDDLIKVKIADSDFNGAYGQLLSADIYVQYRELITTASDNIHAITNASEVADLLGTIHPDNPLAQAVYNAALNAGGQTVRYMAVPTNDLDGYNKVLDAATLTKEVYFFVPVTVSLDAETKEKVLDSVQAHVNSMSAPTSKRWRIAFVSADVPDEDPIYTKVANTDGTDFTADVVATSGSGIAKTLDVRFYTEVDSVKSDNVNTKFKRHLKEDDILVTVFDNTEYGEVVPKRFKIVKILSNSRVRVIAPDSNLVVGADLGKAEIYHPLTNGDKALYIRNLSSQFSDRRVYNVFPSVFTGGGVTQEGEFAAACVAGLVSSCLPQQPVTNLELVGIDDIPLVYQTFSYDELNTIASGGTFIVMQDLPGDQVYVRHQISTDYEANNLNTAELSITKNLDSISFFFDDLLSPYIGKYNITPELLLVLRNVITAGLTSLESTSWGLYGPQIIAEGTEILLLEQDALLKDHVNCNLKLNLPYPFNHLVLKLFV